MHPSARVALLSLSVLGLSSCAHAQTLVGRSDSIYTWRGALPSGALLTIRNVNGPVDVRPGTGNAAELRAEKRTRGRGSLQDVAFEVQTGSGGDVTICSAYRSQNACDSDRGRRNHDDDDWNDRGSTSVAMTVLVPRGTRVRVMTGNGAVSIERVGNDVQGKSVV